MAEVKIINKSKHKLPEYATKGSAGFDIRANVETAIIIHPGDAVAIPTGLYMQLPEGMELQVRPRSGLALKSRITVLNSPGTIDSDYRLEIKIILINHSKENFYIKDGDRIAQGVLAKFEQADWSEVQELEQTERIGGFGSTGSK